MKEATNGGLPRRQEPTEPKSSDPPLDYQALFDASPTPLLVISPPNWTIVAANSAHLELTGATRAETIGRKLFDAFPDDPDDPQATGVLNLSSSLEHVLATRKADTMPLQRYPVRDAQGNFIIRWWSPVNTPVLDGDGEVTFVIHGVEEVTDLVQVQGEAAASEKRALDQQKLIKQHRRNEATLRASEARFVRQWKRRTASFGRTTLRDRW